MRLPFGLYVSLEELDQQLAHIAYRSDDYPISKRYHGKVVPFRERLMQGLIADKISSPIIFVLK